MRYFEIQIPVAPNESFVGFSEQHNLDFETFLLGKVGGMSKLPDVKGVWLDTASGQIYAEKMTPYRFAVLNTNDKLVNEIVTEIANFAKEHYEQIAIFVAEIGTAQIV